MTHSTRTDSALLCIAGTSESDDSFDAKLISAKCIRCRSTANKDLQDCDETAKCSSSVLPAPKIWRRSSKKQEDGTASPTNIKPEVLKQFDMSEVHQISVPYFDAEPTEMDEWSKAFFSLVGLNDA